MEAENGLKMTSSKNSPGEMVTIYFRPSGEDIYI